MDVGTGGMCPPFGGAALASRAEALGFDVLNVGDNQRLTTDPFAELRDAASATSTIRLTVGVANFVTRHPSVIATSIAAVQVASGGRAVCGVGKGDSALAAIGRRPQRHDDFADGLRQLRHHLEPAQLDWVEGTGYEQVPVLVAASGPRTLALAGELADEVVLGVGAAAERLSWAIDVARTSAGSRPLRIAAFLPVAVDDDAAAAFDRLRGRVATWAHMASFPGADVAAQPAPLRRVVGRLRDYDYAQHGRPSAGNRHLVDDEFTAWFGISGTPATVAARILEVGALGVDQVNVVLPPDERDRFALDVLPLVRGTRERDGSGELRPDRLS